MSIRSFLCGLFSCNDFCAPCLPAPSGSVPQPPAPTPSGNKRPEIVCILNTKTNLGVPFDTLVAVMQKYVDQYVVPVWNTPALLTIGTSFKPGAWAMTFTDNADVANALGYHDLTPDGLPISKIFVKTTISDGEEVSVTATHELVEMLVDPSINLLASGVVTDIPLYAYESADAVEETHFAIDGVNVSNFIYPEWFEDFHAPKSVQFDQMGLVTQPFQLLAGGYASVYDGGSWTQIFGSKAKASRFEKEDRRQHRSTYRVIPRDAWKRSIKK